ncbi:MAG: hypothetical protein IT370_25135 [Deltaproteobacteria bacterium]|nr:hypothetical protein [Deltaproteobacteria bacterium]
MLVASGGCYSPDKAKCAFKCGASDPQCPSGYSCGGDQYCHQKGSEAEMCDFPVNTPDGGADTGTPGQPELRVTPATLSATEGGAGVTFALVLSKAPAADVVVTLASSDATAATVTPAMVTFTTANFGLPQTITVTPVNDDDLASESVTVTAMGTGVASASVTVTVTDDDTQAITTSPATTVTVTEGLTGALAVRLAFQPAADVTVTVMSADATTATATPATLTFTAANYATPQDVTITGVDDADTTDDSTMIMLMGTGGLTKAVTVNVTDNDVQNISVTPTTLNLTEQGAAGTFSVTLTQQPGADVIVAVVSADAARATVDKASLTFTSANYNVAQVVTVTTLNDVDLAANTVAIDLTSAPLTARAVSVMIADNDTQGLTIGGTPVTVAEGGATTFTVRLDFMPAADVVVAVNSLDTTAVTTTETMLTFTSGNYATPQTVNVQGVEDADAAAETVNVALSSAALPATVNVAVTTTENDTQAITTSPATTVTVTEALTSTLRVRLAFQPTADVTVTVMSADANTATATATLTFTAADYATPQDVIVTGVDDADTTDDSTMIMLMGTGGLTKAVTVNVTDNDVQNISVTPATLNLTEQGATGMFSVTLTQQPGADVVVAVVSADAPRATVDKASLTFTSADFNVAQVVTVTTLNDVDLVENTVAIDLTSAPLTARAVSVIIEDNDN